MNWKSILTSVIITVLGLIVYNMFVSKWLASELETGYLEGSEKDDAFEAEYSRKEMAFLNGYTEKIAA